VAVVGGLACGARGGSRKKTRWWRQVSMGKRKDKIEWSGVEEQGRPYDVLGPAHTFSM
jgi:hypothetical protein